MNRCIYELSLDMSGNPAGKPTTKQMDVTLANPLTTENCQYNIQTAGNTLGNMLWETFALKFTANATSSLLTFAAGNGGGNSSACCFGAALDNVKISAVPLPAGGLLLLGALGGVAALRRRRKVV